MSGESMPAPDHHLPEIVRRLEDVVGELREMRRTMETTYVRLDVHTAQRSGDRAEVKDLRTDLDAIAAQRQRLMAAVLTSLILPIIASIVVALILTGGGQ